MFEHQKDPPEYLATLEHLDDRWSADRGNRAGEFRVVLACAKCNNDRNRERQNQQPRQELRDRAKQHQTIKLLANDPEPIASLRSAPETQA